MGHDHSSHGMEGQKSNVKVRDRVKVRVSVRNAVGGTSILISGQFSGLIYFLNFRHLVWSPKVGSTNLHFVEVTYMVCRILTRNFFDQQSLTVQ